MSPTQRTPGVALGFDFLAAASAVGSGVLRALVIAPKASGGTATANTLYQDVAGESAAAPAVGVSPTPAVSVDSGRGGRLARVEDRLHQRQDGRAGGLEHLEQLDYQAYLLNK